MARAFGEHLRIALRARRVRAHAEWLANAPEFVSLRAWIAGAAEASTHQRDDAPWLPDYQPRAPLICLLYQLVSTA